MIRENIFEQHTAFKDNLVKDVKAKIAADKMLKKMGKGGKMGISGLKAMLKKKVVKVKDDDIPPIQLESNHAPVQQEEEKE